MKFLLIIMIMTTNNSSSLTSVVIEGSERDCRLAGGKTVSWIKENNTRWSSIMYKCIPVINNGG